MTLNHSTRPVSPELPTGIDRATGATGTTQKVRVNLKPLSVNEAWKGRRFRSTAYKVHETAMLILLPPVTIPKSPFEIHLTFGFSSASSDVDNPTKMTIDILAKKYRFNDKRIARIILDREQVKKGNEYIEFEIRHFEK